ncbi:DNA-binding PadR family transcriptional regulator [Kineococcus xinjiangensis]|uniref:DNA-binding PadR family transcriptional regulator n=1 Tax=Kineococcus xinjiangensis TaxID=512762 RepID=A0A2S6IEG5_9ACTN|nr:DNA-binding PadR family transcriptional regulator [Kineococcus xinjiangensis]
MLGALSVEPMTGYRLRTEIVETLGHFWHESFGQIYPALAGLEREGLVARDAASAGPGNLFRITAAGRRRLRELLAEPFQQPAPRDPLLLRVFFGHHVEPDRLRDWLAEALAQAETACARYEVLRAEIERAPDVATQGRFRLLTLLAGLHGARARADWAREAMDLLDGEGAPG